MIRGRKEGKSYATWFIGFDNGKNPFFLGIDQTPKAMLEYSYLLGVFIFWSVPFVAIFVTGGSFLALAE